MEFYNKESRKQREKLLKEGMSAIEGDIAYSFVNREGVLVCPVKGGLAPVGKAYAFFDCDSPKEVVERELSQIPNSLELFLSQGEAPLFRKYLKTSPLGLAVQEARGRYGQNKEHDYVIEAYSLNKTNENVANSLGNVMNLFYASPLCKKGEFRANIAYEYNKEYRFI